MPSLTLLSEQERILYFYIKKHGWTSQRTLVLYRAKDDRDTRRYLQKMEVKGFLKSKYVEHPSGMYNEKYYNLKH